MNLNLRHKFKFNKKLHCKFINHINREGPICSLKYIKFYGYQGIFKYNLIIKHCHKCNEFESNNKYDNKKT